MISILRFFFGIFRFFVVVLVFFLFVYWRVLRYSLCGLVLFFGRLLFAIGRGKCRLNYVWILRFA